MSLKLKKTFYSKDYWHGGFSAMFKSPLWCQVSEMEEDKDPIAGG